jgi:hypothetical protein
VILCLHGDPLVVDLSLLFSNPKNFELAGMRSVCGGLAKLKRLSQLHPISPAPDYIFGPDLHSQKQDVEVFLLDTFFRSLNARNPNSLVPAEKKLKYASTMIGHPGRMARFMSLFTLSTWRYQTTYRE